MNLEEYLQTLLTQHRYETPQPCTSKPKTRTALGYYLQQCRVVFACNRSIRRGEWCRQVWQYHSHQMWRNIEGGGGRFSVSGLEHLAARQEQPAVIVANHMSMLETVTLPSLILPFLPLSMVVKEILTRYPVFGLVMYTVDPIIVTRSNPREDFRRVMEQGPEILGRGKSILMFPQSTRMPRFSPQAFNTLGVKLARKAGVPVVPLALKTDFQGIGGVLRDLGPLKRDERIHFAFGPAMTVDGTGRDTHQACVEFIKTHVAGWGVEIVD
jgi:1-acyl-sn-glycerol-3-phosphate acyltransferase